MIMTSKGQEAMKLFYQHHPDIIILDLGLPDMDGLDIIKEIRDYSSVPIIVVSARLEEQEKIKALDLGANDYVVKPFYMGELLARIRVARRIVKNNREELKVYHQDYLYVDLTNLRKNLRFKSQLGKKVNAPSPFHRPTDLIKPSDKAPG